MVVNMPVPAIFDIIPDHIKSAWEERQKSNGFADIDGAVAWLQEQGFEVGRSTVGRENRRLKQECDKIAISTKVALAISEAAGDKPIIGRAIATMIQQKMLDELMDYQPSAENVDLASYAKSIGMLNKSELSQLDYIEKVQARAKAAAEEVSVEL